MNFAHSTVLKNSNENSRFAYTYTNRFALIRESYAFIRESFTLIPECYVLIRENFAKVSHLLANDLLLFAKNIIIPLQKYAFVKNTEKIQRQ